MVTDKAVVNYTPHILATLAVAAQFLLGSHPLIGLLCSLLFLALWHFYRTLSFTLLLVAGVIILGWSHASGGPLKLPITMFNLAFFTILLFLRSRDVAPIANTPDANAARLDALWQSVVDGLIVIDDRAKIISANPATETLFGYSEAELVGKNIKMLMPEQYAREHDGYVDAYNKTGHAKIIGIGRDVTGKRKDGSEFPLYLAVSRFTVGDKVFYSGIVRDQTEEVALQKSLVEAKVAAENASVAKSRFLNSISHETRTPLNAVLGFSQILQMELEDTLTPLQQEYLTHIRTGGTHLLNALNDALALSEIESGKLDLKPELVQAEDILREAVKITEKLAQKGKITVRVMPADLSHIHIFADPVRLRQALVHIVSNAIKYNRPSGSVECSLERVNRDQIRFLVKDTGFGIPADEQKNAYLPFNRLGREGSTIAGSGLGLAISKFILEGMNASIAFETEEDRGSSFWITFNIADAETTPKPRMANQI